MIIYSCAADPSVVIVMLMFSIIGIVDFTEPPSFHGAPIHRAGKVKQDDQFQRLCCRGFQRGHAQGDVVGAIIIGGCALGHGEVVIADGLLHLAFCFAARIRQHIQRQERQRHHEDQDPGEKPLANFLLRHKKILLLLPVRREEGGGDLHLATGCRAARAPFRSVALRHRLSPAVPFSVQLLFCEPHRYLCLPIFYVHSIPDLPKNARKFSKNT